MIFSKYVLIEFIFTEGIKSVCMKYRKGHGGHLLYSEREGAAGDWRKLHSEERRDLYMPTILYG